MFSKKSLRSPRTEIFFPITCIRKICFQIGDRNRDCLTIVRCSKTQITLKKVLQLATLQAKSYMQCVAYCCHPMYMNRKVIFQIHVVKVGPIFKIKPLAYMINSFFFEITLGAFEFFLLRYPFYSRVHMIKVPIQQIFLLTWFHSTP